MTSLARWKTTHPHVSHHSDVLGKAWDYLRRVNNENNKTCLADGKENVANYLQHLRHLRHSLKLAIIHENSIFNDTGLFHTHSSFRSICVTIDSFCDSGYILGLFCMEIYICARPLSLFFCDRLIFSVLLQPIFLRDQRTQCAATVGGKLFLLLHFRSCSFMLTNRSTNH